MVATIDNIDKATIVEDSSPTNLQTVMETRYLDHADQEISIDYIYNRQTSYTTW